jgi:hypothetical protein
MPPTATTADNTCAIEILPGGVLEGETSLDGDTVLALASPEMLLSFVGAVSRPAKDASELFDAPASQTADPPIVNTMSARMIEYSIAEFPD